jgi:4-aminobutyrate aminotransferase-like enzyme
MTTTAPSTSPSASSSSSPAPAGPHSHGQALQQSPVLAAAIEAIVREVRSHSEQLTDIRGPRSDAAKQNYESLMARAADVRGRALLYPYLASGLGNGALVELADGSVKWDMISGIGVHFFGHSDPGILAATVRAGTSDIVNHGNLQSGPEVYQFGEQLLRLAKRQSKLAHVYCSTSGAMANENALKVCYQKHASAAPGGAPRVLAFKDCFMGRSVTMSQIGDAAANRIGIPLSTQVDYMPFYDEVAAQQMGQAKHIDACVARLAEYVERYPKQHACFIFELVQGEGGFNTAPRDYFKALMDVCKASNIAVWDDEIQTFGRTEGMFAYEMLDLGQYVDVFCIGKMTQACATLYTADYNPGPGLLSGTFVSGPAQFAAGIEVLSRLENGNWYGKDGAFAKHWRTFKQHVDALIAKHPAWFPQTSPKFGQLPPLVGGVGGMMKFTPFAGDKDKVNKSCKMMFEEGVMSFIAGHGPYHVRMLPPLPVFNEKDWPRVFACIEKGLARAAQ